MDMLMMLTYAALAIIAFKVFHLPVTKWTVTTTALGGAFLMAWIYISMAFFHPYTPHARSYFQTVPIASENRGIVTEVYVKVNQPLKKGDPLYKIDPIPFQSKLDRLMAELKLAETRLDEFARLVKTGAARKTEKERYQSDVASLKAQVDEAQFDLDSTIVRAPSDGHVTQSRVRVGALSGRFKLASMMTFVVKEQTYIIAAFKPNAIQNIKVGAEAEVIFPSIPGKTFSAKVTKLWDEIAEGQLSPRGLEMLSFSAKSPPGRIPVEIEIIDDISSYYLPAGSALGVCVYSDHLAFLGELRRIFLHLFSWQNVMSFDEPSYD